MTVRDLVEIVRKFADRSVDVTVSGGTLLAEVHGDVLQVPIRHDGPRLYCSEAGRDELAEDWVVRRLGNLELLAERILEFVPEDRALVPVPADVSGPSYEAQTREPELVPDVVCALASIPDAAAAEPEGTNVVYLTSEAGEGKTCVLNALARLKARQFLDHKSSWILLPIGLGGRPFMRLDEVITAALTNRFRFPYVYFEALLELVKLRSVVIGLDGFEEMFIESDTGEVASSLGSLVRKLDSQGALIFAARTAYYSYSNLEAQAKLFRSIQDTDVVFGEARLRRWGKDQFIRCCANLGLPGHRAEDIYTGFESRLSPEHPVLTRAVLARRAIEEVLAAGDEKSLVEVLGDGDTSPESVFQRFVEALIRREAEVKWIDRSGDVARPLLTSEEHCVLLMEIAQEMWLDGTEVLSWDVLRDVTDLTVDGLSKGPSVTRQARDRVRQHALLQQTTGGDGFSFEHEEFRAYFLGRRLGALLAGGKAMEARRFLSVRPLPPLAARVAVRFVVSDRDAPDPALAVLADVAAAGPKMSYGRMNAAALQVGIISAGRIQGQRLLGTYLPGDMISGVDISGITFEACVLDRVVVPPTGLQEVAFRECEIGELVCAPGGPRNSGSFDAGSVPEVIRTGRDDVTAAHYAPASKREILEREGFTVLVNAQEPSESSRLDEDERILDVVRAARAFRRATRVNEEILTLRLGLRWGSFERDTLPGLLQRGVLVTEPWEGRGKQRRFRLAVGFDALDRARRLSMGNYQAFLDELTSS